MFTVLKFHKHYFGALEVRPQEMRMGWGRRSRPALPNQKTCLEKDKSNHGFAKEEDGSCCLTWSSKEVMEGGRKGRVLRSQRAPEHPYLEANSSTPSKGNQYP